MPTYFLWGLNALIHWFHVPLCGFWSHVIYHLHPIWPSSRVSPLYHYSRCSVLLNLYSTRTHSCHPTGEHRSRTSMDHRIPMICFSSTPGILWTRQCDSSVLWTVLRQIALTSSSSLMPSRSCLLQSHRPVLLPSTTPSWSYHLPNRRCLSSSSLGVP